MAKSPCGWLPVWEHHKIGGRGGGVGGKHTGFAGLGFFLPLQRLFVAPPLFYIILQKKRHCLLAYLQFVCFHTVYTVFRNDEIFKKIKNLKWKKVVKVNIESSKIFFLSEWKFQNENLIIQADMCWSCQGSIVLC